MGRLGKPMRLHGQRALLCGDYYHRGGWSDAHFWHSPWLEGKKPKDIAPLVFTSSSNKNKSVKEAMQDQNWVHWIKMEDGLSVDHIAQFCTLWEKLSQVELRDDLADDIKWNLTTNGTYSSASAYKVQFEGAVATNMKKVIWGNWAPPKCKFFAWLINKNRVWTADRLQRRGWPNCNLCQLCKREPETAAHIMFQCRFSMRIWNAVRCWLDTPELDTADWAGISSVHEWWTRAVLGHGHRGKAVSSLIMLVSWEVWKERNARVFQKKSSKCQPRC